MILFLTSENEPNCELLIDEISSLRVRWHRINIERLYQDGHCGFSLGDEASLLNLSSQELESIHSVWCRKKLKLKVAHEEPEIGAFIEAEAQDVIDGLPYLLNNSKWVNDLNSNDLAKNTLRQLNTAKHVGLNIPETLVTQSKQQVLNFFKKHDGKIIYKMLHNQPPHLYGYSVPPTRAVNRSEIDLLNEYMICPTLFQEQVEFEVEFRITIVENKVFVAGQVPIDLKNHKDSAVKDIRFSDKRFFACDLPLQIKEKLIRLVRLFNLHYAAIDMALTKDGRYIFFEINPSGQWAWVETATNLPITRSIAQCMINKS